MKTVAGVFKSRADAEHAVTALTTLGICNDIRVLTPEATEKELAQVPTMATEQRGMGTAVGATVGTAIGIAAAGTLGSLLVPGLGPVLAIGIAGGVLGGVGGGMGGGAIEGEGSRGLPEDELFVYEDALRQGRTVIVATADDDAESEAVRGVLVANGAESVDRAQKMWWIGLRDVEKEKYQERGGNFQQDERYFQWGFEAAQHSGNRGKTFEECQAQLGKIYPDAHRSKPFRRGYERGRAYFESLKNSRT